MGGGSPPSLEVDVAGVKLKSPVMNASGVFGWSLEEARIVEEAGGSAFVAKTVTPKPRSGYGRPRMSKAACGFVNAVGLANPGVEEASRLLRETSRRLGIPVFASLAAGSPGEWAKAASILLDAGVSALELNLSCPHFKGGGLELGQDPQAVYRVVSEVVSVAGRVPVIAKLGVADRLVEASSKALEAGASGITLINSVKAMKIDIYTSKPVLSNIVGGLSGRAIHPIAVRAVYEVYRETQAHIIGVGGVYTWEDAVELMMAGARAVQVGAAILEKGPKVLGEIAEGIRRFLWVQGYGSVSDIIGVAAR